MTKTTSEIEKKTFIFKENLFKIDLSDDISSVTQMTQDET